MVISREGVTWNEDGGSTFIVYLSFTPCSHLHSEPFLCRLGSVSGIFLGVRLRLHLPYKLGVVGLDVGFLSMLGQVE